MQASITINKEELCKVITDYVRIKTGIEIDSKYLRIMVKSKQNYKSEWEDADFKAIYDYKVLD